MKRGKVRIDKGIPLPMRGYGSKYPWADIEIGDSFLIDAKSSAAAHSMARKARIDLGRNFQARETTEGWRVWRVEPKKNKPQWR